MTAFVLVVFGVVYLGMVLGRVPGLALDRTGMALVGAIALIVGGAVEPHEGWQAIDVSTIGLLFGLMVVSAQFRLGGFYTVVARRLASARMGPGLLLLAVIAVTALLSALLCNDIVCLAVAPLLVEGCARRRLDPKPYLLALACAANVGSAATLIGNPQNMLIGQALNLSFAGYLGMAAVPVLLSLAVTWAIIWAQTHERWERETPVPHVTAPAFNIWQTGKGLALLTLLIAGFLFSGLPREILALGAAGVLLMSRRMHTRHMLGLVDWHLLVLFAGLFIVNHALQQSGLVAAAMDALARAGLDVSSPPWLFGTAAVLSNVVSNVPATMLLLPAATHPLAGPVLALSSTLAGNLIIVGSIANIIVVDQAERLGTRISWADHARTGVPVTLATLAISGAWLWLVA